MWQVFVQYLAFYINENLPNSIKMAEVGSNFLPKTIQTLKNIRRALNFCQSGEISSDLVTLVCHPIEGMGQVIERSSDVFSRENIVFFIFNVEPQEDHDDDDGRDH